MSNTSSKMNPKKLIAYYSGNVLSVIVGGRHRRFYAEQAGESRLKEIYETVKRFKEAGREEDAEKLESFMDPNYRAEVGNGLLQDMEGTYYLEELPHIPLPGAIRKMLLHYAETGLDTTPIINLWKLAADNPNEQARKDLMEYIERFGVPVTDSGYMVLYKSVRDRNNVIEKLAYIVGQEYFEKMKRRQSPQHWYVYELTPDHQELFENEERFFLTEEPSLTRYYHDGFEEKTIVLEPVGNLAQLFKDLVIDKQDLEATDEEKEPIFEPYYRGDSGMEIRLGTVVSMDREECDPNINNACSYGLHVGSYEYVSNFNNSDGTVLAVLVNPRDIVALPQYDHSKIRTCAYLPYGILKQDENGKWEEAEATYWEEDFIDYEKDALEARIEELARQKQEGRSGLSDIQIDELISLHKDRLVKLGA